MLLEKAENDESARDELLNVLSGAPAQEAEVEEVAGIPFANQQAADTTRKELVTAINVLTSSIANASLSIDFCRKLCFTLICSGNCCLRVVSSCSLPF